MHERVVGEGQPRFPIQFSHQRGDRYRFMVDEGVISDLSTSGLCWLAATDMALSAFLQDPSQRHEIIRRIALSTNQEELLGPDGRLYLPNLEEFVDIVNMVNRAASVPVVAATVDGHDYHRLFSSSLAQGVALFEIGDGIRRHTQLVDEDIFLGDEGKVAFRIWDPLKTNESEGKELMTSDELRLWLEREQLAFMPPLVVFSHAQQNHSQPFVSQSSLKQSADLFSSDRQVA